MTTRSDSPTTGPGRDAACRRADARPASSRGRTLAGSVLVALLLAPALVAVVPVLAAATALVPAAVAAAPADGARPLGAIALRTLAFAGGAAVIAVAAAFPLGLRLGRASAAGRARGLLVLPTVVACVPPSVVFHAWWTLWPPDGAVYAFALEHGIVPQLRSATLVVALAAWATGIATWTVAASAAVSDPARDARRLEGTGPVRETAAALRRHAGAALVSIALVTIVLVGETAAYDLAQVFSLGNELRAIDALGGTPAQVLRAGWPAFAVAAAGAGLAWWRLGPRDRTRAAVRATTPVGPGSTVGRLAAATPLVVLALVPLAGLVGSATEHVEPGAFLSLHAGGLGRTAVAAALAAAGAAAAGTGLAILGAGGRRARAIAGACSLACLVVALVPGSLAGPLVHAAWRAVPDPAAALVSSLAPGGIGSDPRPTVADADVVVALGLLARFAAVAALLARIAVSREPRSARDARRLDGLDGPGGPGGVPGLLAALAPRLVPAAVAAFALVFVLGLGEIPVTARVHPPGFDPVMVAVMNAMHYQRPETAALASVLLAGTGAVAAGVLAWASGRFGAGGPGDRGGARRRGRALGRGITSAALLGLACAVLPGCDGGATGDAAAPVPVVRTLGGHGLAPGRFSRPRCLDVAPDGSRLVVIDKTARVQVLDRDGGVVAAWRMPAFDTGKPTGVTLGPEGRVWVADTHQHRIAIFAPDGTLERTFGRYGEEPGALIYPTDVAFGPDGLVWVSEYGGNDRVQAFTPEGEVVRTIGGFGWDDDRFNRPQALAFSPDGAELYVADACNHRIVVRDPARDGAPVLRVLGGAGTGAGRLHYPYGLDVLADGTLLVTEFGNHRVQRLEPDGTSLGTWGRPGTREGALRYPWSAAAAGGEVFVLDSGNDRIQVFRDPAGGRSR